MKVELETREAEHRALLQAACKTRRAYQSPAAAFASIWQLPERLKHHKTLYWCPAEGCGLFHYADTQKHFASLLKAAQETRALSSDPTPRLKNRVYTAAEAGRRIAARDMLKLDPQLIEGSARAAMADQDAPRHAFVEMSCGDFAKVPE